MLTVLEGFSSQYLLTDRVLGVGGFGRVMVAIHQHTQRQVACKAVDLRRWWSIPPISMSRRPTGTHEQIRDGFSTDSRGPRKSWPNRVVKCFREFDILKNLTHVISTLEAGWTVLTSHSQI